MRLVQPPDFRKALLVKELANANEPQKGFRHEKGNTLNMAHFSFSNASETSPGPPSPGQVLKAAMVSNPNQEAWMHEQVYYFGKDGAEGAEVSKEILGGKGRGLAEMTAMGLPVPPGFTITTAVCAKYYELGKKYPAELESAVNEALARLESEMGARFSDPNNPLLVSVRSGAAVSMPGMMDTILNLGLSDVAVEGLAKKTNNPRMAWDAYRRLIQMYGDVVLRVEKANFDHVLHGVKQHYGLNLDTELSVENLKEVVDGYKKVVVEHLGRPFPQDAKEQLWGAIGAVFSSWNNERANAYRKINDIKGLIGTAVNVQAMVFGNFGDTSGTGVCFTRNPSNGENEFYGEYLVNAQGEDVVAGIRTPQPIKKLHEDMPAVYDQLVVIKNNLETHFRDMQDIEFTIQEGRLFILQTRNGKRTAFAAVKIAVDMVEEGLISEKEAILRVNPNDITQLLLPRFPDKVKKEALESGKVIAHGLPASPGAAVGEVVFSAEDAVLKAEKGRSVILVRIETSPEDVMGMHMSKGILTATGGMTSHAAVVARGMGRCCVAGCGSIAIDYSKKQFKVAGKDIVVKEGDIISLDGFAGDVMVGSVQTAAPEIGGSFEVFMKWVDATRQIKVRTNAETPSDVRNAVKFGAEGIGLARTEHMFFEKDRIPSVRKMILASNEADRREAVLELLPHQQSDFESIFRLMAGKPVTIRTLDPPLHEFLPQEFKQQKELADEMGLDVNVLIAKVKELHEANPMLGHRGCRLGITYPEITEMQARAIFQAAAVVAKEGIKVIPEVMIPLVGTHQELAHQEKLVRDVATSVFAEYGVTVEYLVGTMIEVPRAALTADEIARHAEFFSFGTNDLTQMTFGYSRDDYGPFAKVYLSNNILEYDPFQVLDQTGVGQLVEMAVKKGRATKPGLKCGICGEHGGEPRSVIFCHRVGLDYVSCSPFRVPVARVAAAQAALKYPR
jgi:pyruvate,orthophosphate dikinase